MKILKEGLKSFAQDPTRFFNFERFQNLSNDFLLVDGFIDFRILEKYKNEKIVYLEFEEPNRFAISDEKFNLEHEYEKYFYKVLSICPYTVEWKNSISKSNKWKHVFFPFNEELIVHSPVKSSDIVYCGHVNSKEILGNIIDISRFKYRFVSNSNSEYVTDFDVTYKQKLKIISESKITLVHNLLFLDKNKISNLYRFSNYYENQAFRYVPSRMSLKRVVNSLLDKDVLVPQIKSRVFEAAFCKSLILCRKDDFNVIEQFFTPGKEFLYYEEGELVSTVEHILSRYKDYEMIIDNAYRKAVKCYTTRIFFEKYLKNL